MANILCLAHYCDTHGPTPLMVTEGLLVDCHSCVEEDALNSRRSSTFNATEITDSQKGGRTNSSSLDKENGGFPNPRLDTDTPPESPRVQAAQFANLQRRDSSSFRKTYDENDKKRATPCENCALTLPKKTKEEGAPKTKLDSSGPILRTRKPYKRVSKPHNDPSPPKSASSSDSESAVTTKPPTSSHRRTGSKSLKRQGTASSSSSSFSSTMSHDHYLDYTSTHEPLQATSFSIIRQSCLRTLSCETHPPSSSSTTSNPTSPNPFSSASSLNLNSTSSGDPIFFGDPLAGYTTAYIFRIPDPNARGRRRVYALMCLTTHRERIAMKMFSHLSTMFKEIATWIQLLAEAELERSESSLHSPRLNPIDEQNKYRSGGSQSTPTSAFLSGRNRGLDGKFASMSLRARGLAELVGLPDFFLELHTKFVRLLMELNLIVNS